MSQTFDLVIVDSAGQPATTCVVCGQAVEAGAGVTARYRGRTLRFKCPGCLPRFEADPERYLAGETAECCDGADHDGSSHRA